MPVIREKRQFGSVRSVGVVKMDTGESKKYSRIAEATQQLTNLAVNEMARISESTAKKSAEELSSSQITTINPKTGKPEALDWIGDNRFIGRTAANAYARVVSDRFQNEIDNQIKERANRIALQYENDPYSVEKYEDQMTAYLEGLAKGSEENGKKTAYTNYILDQGTQFITATKLSMMQERNRRERNKLTASVLEQNEEDKQIAYNFGVTGRALEIEGLVEASVDRNLDAEASNLTKLGSAQSHASLMETAYVDGSISRIMSKLNGRAVDRANVVLALITENTNDLPKDIQAEVDAVLPFVEFKNRDAVVRHATSLSNKYGASDTAQQAQKTALQKITADRNKILYRNASQALENDTARDINSGMQSSNINDLVSALRLSEKDLEVTNDEIENDSILTRAEKDSQKKDNAKKVLRNALLAGASDNNFTNVTAFKESILRKTKSPDLTPRQSIIVDVLLKTNIYDANENEVFVRTYLDSIEGDEAKRLAEQNAMNLKLEVEAVSLDFHTGNINLTVLDQITSKITEASFLSEPEKENQKSQIRRSISRGYVNGAAISSSTEMNQLYLYVDNSGKVKSFDGVEVPLNVQKIGEQILSIANVDDITNILSTISQRTSKLRSNEQDRINTEKAADEEQQFFMKAKFGGPNALTKKERQKLDNTIRSQGIAENASDPRSVSPEYYAMVKNGIPDSMFMGLKSLINPSPFLKEEEAVILMQHFDTLSYDFDMVSRRPVNRLHGVLGQDYAILQEISDIRKLDSSRGVLEIAADLNGIFKNKIVSDQNFENVFGNETVEDVLSKRYNEDRKIVEEFAPLAKYYARIGKNKDDIFYLLDDMAERNYLKSEYILDPEMPLGDLKRSRFSLARMFPNQEEQKEFLRIIEENLLNLNLKHKYSIFPSGGLPTGSTLSSDNFEPDVTEGFPYPTDTPLNTDEEIRRVYLVPNENAGSPQYYTYFINPKTNEAEALIFQKDGEDFWPMFDMSTTEDWRKADILKSFEDAQAQAEKNKLMFDGIKTTLGKTGELTTDMYYGIPRGIGTKPKDKDNFIAESNSE